MTEDHSLNRALLEAAQREQRLAAEELHDTICQSLAGTSLLVKLLLRRVEAGKTIEAAELKKISGYLDDAIDDARFLVEAQAIPPLKLGLMKALEKLARLTGRRIKCRFHTEAEVGMDDPEVAKVLYQIARETVREMICRASAREIVLSLLERDGGIEMEIRNETPSGSDRRLEGVDFLRRYAEAVGIEFRVEARPESATVVRCVFRTPSSPAKAVKKKTAESATDDALPSRSL